MNRQPPRNDFRNQMPLKLGVTDFQGAQWMFYPPEELSVTVSEAYHDGKEGELSQHEPRGDVVMFCGRFGSAAGLNDPGRAMYRGAGTYRGCPVRW